MDYVLGIDLGTSYFKLGLFNKKGELCGLGRIHVPKDKGDGSLCEVPVNRFWKLLKHGLNEACLQAQINSDQIKAVSYSSQANSFLLLDKKNLPLTPLILWSDNRAKYMQNIQDLFHKKDFKEKTGLGIDCSHQFCVSKLLWLQKYRPDLWDKTSYCMTISDYFTYSLTNQLVGDAGTASLLGLLNIHTRKWLPDIIDLSTLHLSTPLLPGTLVGGLCEQGAELLGLTAHIPFVVGSLDHHIAGIGAGLGYIAEMSESTGTVLACLKFNSEFAPGENVCTGAGLNKGSYYQLVFDANGASSLEGYRQKYAPQFSIADLEKKAESVGIGSAGLIAKPGAYTYKERDGFVNISSEHHHGHFTRAILESTAASLKKLVDQLAGKDRPKRIVATGGGAKSDLWLQIKADMLGIEFLTTQTQVPACRGAAMLASIAAGWYPDLFSVTQQWVKINKSFQPISENQEKYREWYAKMMDV